MTTKPTEGPLTTSAVHGQVTVFSHCVRIEKGGDVLALIVGGERNLEANAAMFAAAPELLTSLKDAYRLMPLGAKKRTDWLMAAAAAIAKAEGAK